MYIPDRAERRYEALISGEMHVCSGKSAPKAPDYKGAAEATAASDRVALRDQTYANRPEQNTPWGSTNWTTEEVVDPATGEKVTKWIQDTSLNEDSQRALDAQLGLSANKSELGAGMYDRMAAEYADPMDWDGLSEVTGGMEARNRAEDAIYNRAASRLDPQWQQREEQTQARLVAQGLRPGDPAYDQAMENLGRERTDAYDRATTSSIMGGGQEMSRQYGMESNERNRQLAEQMQKRGFTLNEINAIISGQQVGMPQMPGYSQAGRGMATDYSGAAQAGHQAEMDAFSADQAMWQGLMQGGASLAMMCDRRLKRDIIQIGWFKQYPMYAFRYIWGAVGMGPMSDEVNRDAVTVLPSGYEVVDLARVS